ncbi:MAG: D-alanine--D-alanine ligase [Hyphomicrobiales bacterium]
MAKAKHIAVLMGGWSAERPVSLASGKPCAEALRGCGYDVTEVDVDRNVSSVLSDLKPDAVFNALHGPFGEDGNIQGVLEFLNIPYTHSGVMASALAMNKEKAKLVMAGAGVPVASSKVMHRMDAAKTHVMKPPYVIKPVNEGSSFGVLIVNEDHEHPPQELYSDNWPYGDIVMVEKYVAGRELTCAVLGDKAMAVIDIISQGSGFYDFDAKYAEGGSVHVLPADLPGDVYKSIQSYALAAHKALGCRGVSRADFRYDEANAELICLEVNTQPGMTPTSLVPEMAADAGFDFGALMRWMVEDASCNR